jgi:hypothetical protein
MLSGMMQAQRYMRTAKAALAAAVLGMAIAAGGPALAGKKPPTVVELFTSQGCSSCPPADKFMGELAQRDDILALTYHVDYWDYIGWKDTFATEETTARQHAYGQSLGQRYVYTPQMVIGGRVHKVGSHRMAVNMAIEETARLEQIEITVKPMAGGKVAVSIPKGAGSGDIMLMRFDNKHTVDVGRGENAGRQLNYYNVVRDFRRLGRWTGDAMELVLQQDTLAEGGRDGCAIVVQEERNGPVLGATRIDFAALTN